jgi:hypothetical protein
MRESRPALAPSRLVGQIEPTGGWGRDLLTSRSEVVTALRYPCRSQQADACRWLWHWINRKTSEISISAHVWNDDVTNVSRGCCGLLRVAADRRPVVFLRHNRRVTERCRLPEVSARITSDNL